MKLAVAGSILTLLAFGQNAEQPRFLAADVHVSAKTQNQFMRPPSTRGEHYDVKNATMVDLISMAYATDPTKVVGGPNWLDWDRFDVLAKAPQATTRENLNLMLQNLLADRFKVKFHWDTREIDGFAMTVAKNGPKIREAGPDEEERVSALSILDFDLEFVACRGFAS